MQHLQKHNDTLPEQLDLLSYRPLASQEAQSEAELRWQHAAQDQVFIADAANSDLHNMSCLSSQGTLGLFWASVC